MISRNYLKKAKGITLIELLVYIGILSILLLVITDIFVATVNIRTQSEATSSVDQDGRYILARLAYDFGQATQVSLPVNLGDTADSLTIIIGNENFRYQVVSGNLQLANNSGSYNLNSNQAIIGPVSFTKIGNVGGKDTVMVQLTISSAIQRTNGPETKTYQTTLGRRN